MDSYLTISYLFSIPLLYNNEPLPSINIYDDQLTLINSIIESNKKIKLLSDNATPDKLRSIITKGIKIIHFSGHGLDQSLAFENGLGNINLNFSIDKLKTLFEAGNTKGVEFVFVAACNSEFVGNAFISAGVPHVVAVRCNPLDMQAGLVSDKAARVFSSSFYLALFCGRTVRQSFDIGKARVLSDSSLICSTDADKFKLLPEHINSEEKDPNDVVLFPNLNSGKCYIESLLPNILPTQPEHFYGRNHEAQKIIVAINSRRFVILKGIKGSGKTSTLLFTAHYMLIRKMFPIIYLDISKFDNNHNNNFETYSKSILNFILNSIRGFLLKCDDTPIQSPHEINDVSFSNIPNLTIGLPSSSQSSDNIFSKPLKEFSSELSEIYDINFNIQSVSSLLSHRPILIIFDNIYSPEISTYISKIVINLLGACSLLKIIIGDSHLEYFQSVSPTVISIQSLSLSSCIKIFSTTSRSISQPEIVQYNAYFSSITNRTIRIANLRPNEPEYFAFLTHICHFHPFTISLVSYALQYISLPLIIHLIMTWRENKSIINDANIDSKIQINIALSTTPKSFNNIFLFPLSELPSDLLLKLFNAIKFLPIMESKVNIPATSLNSLEIIERPSNVSYESPDDDILSAVKFRLIRCEYPNALELLQNTIFSIEINSLLYADALFIRSEILFRMLKIEDSFSSLTESFSIYLKFQDKIGIAWSLKLFSEIRLTSVQYFCGHFSLYTIPGNGSLELKQVVRDAFINKNSVEHFLIELASFSTENRKMSQDLSVVRNSAITIATKEAEYSISLFTILKNSAGLACSLRNLGWAQLLSHSFSEGLASLEMSKSCGIQSNCNLSLGWTTRILAALYISHQKHELARNELLFALRNFREISNPFGEASCLRSLGELHFFLGQYDAAGFHLRLALNILEKNVFLLREKAIVLRALGQVQLALGQELGLSNVESAVVLFQSIRSTPFCSQNILLALPNVLFKNERPSVKPPELALAKSHFLSVTGVSIGKNSNVSFISNSNMSFTYPGLTVPIGAEIESFNNDDSKELQDEYSSLFSCISFMIQKWQKSLSTPSFWSYAATRMPKLKKRARIGIPESLRGSIYKLFLNCEQFKSFHPSGFFTQLSLTINDNDLFSDFEVRVDELFSTTSLSKHYRGVFVPKISLSRISFCICKYDPDYFKLIQSQLATNSNLLCIVNIVAYFVMIMPEEDAFWCIISILKGKLNLFAFFINEEIRSNRVNTLIRLVEMSNPNLLSLLKSKDLDNIFISIVCSFFGSLCSSVLDADLLLRLWDCLFFEGDKVIYRLILLFFKNSSTQLNALLLNSKKDQDKNLLSKSIEICLVQQSSHLIQNPDDFIAAMLDIPLKSKQLEL